MNLKMCAAAVLVLARPHRDSVPLAQATGLRRKPRNGWGQPSPEGAMASLMPASWNRITAWLKQIDELRRESDP